MSRVALAVVMASLSSLAAAQHASARAQGTPNPAGTIVYRVLDNPKGGDDFLLRLAEQQKAQARSNAVFAALRALLGGQAPELNFVPNGSPLLVPPAGFSANLLDTPGASAGTINLDPRAVYSLISDDGLGHSMAVNQMPHEMAHLRQTAPVLAQALDREGGAQAFADFVAQQAALKAGIPYVPGNFDGAYADYVNQINAQMGRDWILAGQFGKTGSPVWP